MAIILKKMTSNDLINFIAWLVVGLAIFIMLLPVYHWLWARWTEYESYYSHGPLVVVIAIFLMIKSFNTGIGSRVNLFSNFSKIDLVFLLIGIAVYLLACFLKIYFLIVFSVWLISFVILHATFEPSFFRKLRFPLCFLLLALPLPMVFSEQLALFLKNLSAKLAGKLLTSIGIVTKVVGNILYTPYSRLEVGAPCSGLRSIVSLVTMAILLSYLNKMSYKKTLGLVILAPFVAFCGNIIRVFCLGFVADIYGEKIALGIFHDTLGYVVFIGDLFVLFLLAKLLNWQGKG